MFNIAFTVAFIIVAKLFAGDRYHGRLPLVTAKRQRRITKCLVILVFLVRLII